MAKYKYVDITTSKGLKRAEWYKAHGWKIIQSSIWTIVFEK